MIPPRLRFAAAEGRGRSHSQAEISRYARMVPVAEISDPKNDFNLNLPRYIDITEPEE
jgi:type I restriction enzyme M protein